MLGKCSPSNRVSAKGKGPLAAELKGCCEEVAAEEEDAWEDEAMFAEND